MSTVYLHVGQAGNQIGEDLWKCLINESGSMSEDIFFCRKRQIARGILVDSEPKVIKRIHDDKILSVLFPPQNMIFSENGRGNNWALGFSKTYKESHISAKVDEITLHEGAMEALRKEAEQADYFLGTVMTHSLAGGTGSGLGSRLLHEYRDYFGKAYLMTVSVWPSMTGETPLQHYNTCFSMAHI